MLLPDDEDVYAYTRTYKDDMLLIVCNFSSSVQTRSFSELGERKVDRILSNEDSKQTYSLENVELSPYEAFIYRLT